ncbi:MAG: TldD/PmbA family protein [Jatrophihabitantaceae bacterium]
MPDLDPSFLALPARELAGAALGRARELGAEHADFRLERIRVATLSLRDAHLDASTDSEDVGLSVRVVHDGAWGFASGIARTADAAAQLAEQAVATARVSRVLSSEPVVLAPEPVYADATWVSAYDLNPFDVGEAERVARLTELSERLLSADGVDHVDANLMQVLENKFYADTAGTMTTQQRVRVHPAFTAVNVDRGAGSFASMRTLAPPAGRGWEYLVGTGWDFDAEIDELPELLREHVKAPTVEPGSYDLVIDPSNLWLTIHESIGHATELDRALGYEAAYAGTSFATPDKLGSLAYGSPVMNVTGDRTAEHGLASIGYDDEGVATQQFDIVRDGTLVGYQLNRQMAQAHRSGVTAGDTARSNGCAFADSAGHIPLQRMANVSLQPAQSGAAGPAPSTAELIAGVERGIYVKGDRSWSIDMQRFNFQFTGQQFHRIENGQLTGQLRDVAYQATTTEFWGSMEAVGGPDTYVLGGAFNCGKGQPGQVAAVSHGCPSALFRGVNVLNTKSEGGR